MLTTLQQAKKMKELGFDRPTQKSYQLVPASACNDSEQYGDTKFVTLCESSCKTRFELISAPSVSEALEWFREVKGIHCSVSLQHVLGWVYVGKYLDKSKLDLQYTGSFNTHSVAELALLDEVIRYVEK